MRLLALSLVFLLASGVARADTNPDAEALAELLATKIRVVQHMALNPVLVRAVRRQNAEGLTAELIASRDREWQDTKTESPLKWSLQQSRAGRFLRAQVAGNGGFNEAFLVDGQGANVAAYPPTSDYFQGDEDKWRESFNGGEGKVYLGPLERDASTDTQAVQISAPVIDRGRTIGVLVVGVKASYVDGRAAAAAR